MLYRDEHCLIFADKVQSRAEAHYQCVPKRHIMNLTYLKLEGSSEDAPTPDFVLMKHMESVGHAFLLAEHSTKVDRY